MKLSRKISLLIALSALISAPACSKKSTTFGSAKTTKRIKPTDLMGSLEKGDGMPSAEEYRQSAEVQLEKPLDGVFEENLKNVKKYLGHDAIEVYGVTIDDPLSMAEELVDKLQDSGVWYETTAEILEDAEISEDLTDLDTAKQYIEDSKDGLEEYREALADIDDPAGSRAQRGRAQRCGQLPE